jgi:hypothetical protein
MFVIFEREIATGYSREFICDGLRAQAWPIFYSADTDRGIRRSGIKETPARDSEPSRDLLNKFGRKSRPIP